MAPTTQMFFKAGLWTLSTMVQRHMQLCFANRLYRKLLIELLWPNNLLTWHKLMNSTGIQFKQIFVGFRDEKEIGMLARSSCHKSRVNFEKNIFKLLFGMSGWQTIYATNSKCITSAKITHPFIAKPQLFLFWLLGLTVHLMGRCCTSNAVCPMLSTVPWTVINYKIWENVCCRKPMDFCWPFNSK